MNLHRANLGRTTRAVSATSSCSRRQANEGKGEKKQQGATKNRPHRDFDFGLCRCFQIRLDACKGMEPVSPQSKCFELDWYLQSQHPQAPYRRCSRTQQCQDFCTCRPRS